MAGFNAAPMRCTSNLLSLAALLAWASAADAQIGVTTIVNLTNSVWRYDDAGIDRGTAWREVSYPAESQWRSGTGLFGLEGSLPYPYPTPVRTPMLVSGGRPTYYFRARFNFSGNPAGLNIIAKGYIDDGAIVYLNGAEVRRVRMPAGTITFTTRAQLATPEGQVVEFAIPVNYLVQGDNVLAVEVHQQSSTSSDVVFGLSLETASSQLPAFLSVDEPTDRSVDQDASTTLVAQASGFPAPAFQWFRNGAAIAGAAADSYLIPAMALGDAGDYFCVASNSAGSVTSRVATLTYVPDTNGVRILYALGLEDPTMIRVAFSEAPDPGAAMDNFEWLVLSEDRSTTLTVVFGERDNGSSTEFIFTTDVPRDPNTVYILQRGAQLDEFVNHGNPLAAGSEVSIASFAAPLVLVDDFQQWRLNQSGTDLGTAWRATDYDDTAWTNRYAPFDAYRQADGSMCRLFVPVLESQVRSCLTLSNAANTAQIPTIYFRTRFVFNGDAAHSLLKLQIAINDGAVFYLNGVEFLRTGMASGDITYDSLATRSFGDAISETHIVHAPTLIGGTNLLAVELHQGTLRSESITLAAEVSGIFPTRPATVQPQLLIRRLDDPSFSEVIWSPRNGHLESSDDLSAGWETVQANHNSGRLVTPTIALQRFYRIVIP